MSKGDVRFTVTGHSDADGTVTLADLERAIEKAKLLEMSSHARVHAKTKAVFSADGPRVKELIIIDRED